MLMSVPVLMLMVCTAYTPSLEECGKTDGMTASGVVAQEGVTVACDNLPFGTRVEIDGHIYTVQDRFGGGYTNRLDIFMTDRNRALQFGRQVKSVRILQDR